MPRSSPTRKPLFGRLKLRSKVAILLVALSVGPLLLVGGLNVDRAVEHGKTMEQERYGQEVLFAAAAYVDLFEQIASDLSLLARRFPASSPQLDAVRRSGPAAQAMLPHFSDWRDVDIFEHLRREYSATFAMLPSGQIFFSRPYARRAINVSGAPWFKAALAGDLVLGKLPPFTTKNPSLIRLRPAIGPDGRITAYVGIVVSTARLNAIAQWTIHSSSAQTLNLITPDQRIAASTQPGPLGRLLEAHLHKAQSAEAVEILGEPEMLVATTSAGLKGWRVQAGTPTRTAYHEVYVLIWVVVGVILLTFVFVLLFADYLASVLLKPIKELERGAEMIGAGVLDYRIEMAGHGDDELGHLAAAFNAMGENLLRNRRELDAYSRALESNNQELDAMVFAITHDLKKPLRGIEAFTTFIGEDYAEAFDDEGRELLTAISGNVDRINHLADDLIRLVEQRRTRGDASRFSMLELLEEIRGKVLEQHAGEVVIHDPMPEVVADRTRLCLALTALIDNALKFNHDDTPRVEIRCTDRGADWVFDIEDNGIGIEEAYLGQIFDLFTRLNHVDAFAGSGTGLNLAKRIIEEHRGTLKAMPRPTGGAAFVLTLPKDPSFLTQPGQRRAS